MSKTRNIQLKNTHNPHHKIHIELNYTDCGLAEDLDDAIHTIIDANRGNGWVIEEETEISVNE